MSQYMCYADRGWFEDLNVARGFSDSYRTFSRLSFPIDRRFQRANRMTFSGGTDTLETYDLVLPPDMTGGAL